MYYFSLQFSRHCTILSLEYLHPGSGPDSQRYGMALAHSMVFLSQKPGTKDGIIRPAILFLAWWSLSSCYYLHGICFDPLTVKRLSIELRCRFKVLLFIVREVLFLKHEEECKLKCSLFKIPFSCTLYGIFNASLQLPISEHLALQMTITSLV